MVFRFSGGHSGRETPGPIPNPVVKPSNADGTARGIVWESKTLPEYLYCSFPQGGRSITLPISFPTIVGGSSAPGGSPAPTHLCAHV